MRSSTFEVLLRSRVPPENRRQTTNRAAPISWHLSLLPVVWVGVLHKSPQCLYPGGGGKSQAGHGFLSTNVRCLERQRTFVDRNPCPACDFPPPPGSPSCRRSPWRGFPERSLLSGGNCLLKDFFYYWQFAPWRRKGEQDQVNDCCLLDSKIICG